MHNSWTRKTQVRKKTRNMTLKKNLKKVMKLMKSLIHAKTREMTN